MQTKENRQPLYPLEPWGLTERSFDTATILLDETLFALGNGAIGLRGAHEEEHGGSPGSSLDGTYLNGFYEAEPIQYPETAYGLAHTNQFMLNVPNGKRIDLYVEGERFDLLQGTTAAYERRLDFRTGMLSRTVEWASFSGHRIAITSQRLVSFEHRHVFAIRYEVTPLNFSGRLRLVSILDGRVHNLEAGDDPRVGSMVSGPVLHLLDVAQEHSFSALIQRTQNSGLVLVSAITNELCVAGIAVASSESARDGERLEQGYELLALEGQPVCLTKFGAYLSSREFPEGELIPRAREMLDTVRAAGFEALCEAQQRFLAAFWHQAEVEIAGDEALAQGMHFNEFHLLQSVGRDGITAIAAKGVTGEGYEGHYFWDTEIYVFPFFLYTEPAIARALLHYRYGTLDGARTRARQMSHARGALYPWRTIAGEECSAYFPAGTAQYHINADIAYAVKLYWEVTGDEDFLLAHGAEMVMETARIWMDLGAFIPARDNAFCINEVTGPDEYTALVNNNYYTNAMAQMHLRFAADVADRLAQSAPAQFARLAFAMNLQPDEPAAWRQAAEHMYLPYDKALGIHPQDDTFLARKVWDFAATPADHYPLLLHYHPLVIYRYQVCKQADVVLALLLLGDRFTLEEKKRDFDYYEAVTTHDSSLSPCVFGILASEIGYAEKAYDYFMETARMDIDNSHNNTQYGVHTAAMAGSWLGMVYGFAGMRVHGGRARFAPLLPSRWDHYMFKVRLHGSLLQIAVGREKTEYRLLEGDALAFNHRDSTVELSLAAPSRAFETVRP